MLLGRRFQAVDVLAVDVFDIVAVLAIVRPNQVAEDREQPGRARSSPGPERIIVGQGPVQSEHSCSEPSSERA